MPTVTVVVPAYNAEKYIEETLNCLKNQTLSDMEVIVVNDGSTDSTERTVSIFCESDDRFCLVNQKNGGVSSARNNGLMRASGRYILFLDSDDLLTEDALEEFAKRLDETGADIAIGRLQSFGEVEEKYNGYAEALSKCDTIDKFNKTLLWNFLVGNKCYRVETLLRSGITFPKLGYSEEGAFFMELVLSDAVEKIVGADKPCMKYRRHDAANEPSVSQRVTRKLISDFLNAIERIYAAAERALANESDEKRENYLQEILYKGDYVLISQFYRLIWQTDDEMLEVIRQGHERYLERMTASAKGRIERLNADLGVLIFDRGEIAKNPKISVIIDLCDEAARDALSSVYLQTMPYFEVLVRQSFFDSESFPERWRHAENLSVLRDADFKAEARAMAKADKRLMLSKPCKTDPRMFRFLEKVSIPNTIKNAFYTPIYKIAETAVRIKNGK